MLVDTHCHINMMVKKNFDVPLTDSELNDADQIVNDAIAAGVTRIINVGTSYVESANSVRLAQRFNTVHATVGIHPNDCTSDWKNDFEKIKQLVTRKEDNKIVGIGECGIDRHYPDYNLQRQRDAFKAHIELALENELALVIHSRDAYDETLRELEEFKKDIKRGVMHCFSYDQNFADYVTQMGLMIGIDAPITYPKNNELRAIVQKINLTHIVLETDAPFLPPQKLRGHQNHPKYLVTVAEFIAEIRQQSLETISQQTTKNALELFAIQ